MNEAIEQLKREQAREPVVGGPPSFDMVKIRPQVHKSHKSNVVEALGELERFAAKWNLWVVSMGEAISSHHSQTASVQSQGTESVHSDER